MIHNHEVESSSLSPATKENLSVLLFVFTFPLPLPLADERLVHGRPHGFVCCALPLPGLRPDAWAESYSAESAVTEP